MSGFAGMVTADGGPVDEHLLEGWAEQLKFRGPDGISISVEEGAGFCFTFLRTGPAPQASKQPCTLDGRVWFFGEARLDGREELVQRLKDRCGDISSEAPEENLILLSWKAWGEAGLEKLQGDFAFVLWDPEARRLVCARDLVGAKPFYYANSKNRFYFSNSLDAVRGAPEVSGGLDQRFIGDFLLSEWSGDPETTVYRDVRRLPPGHVLTYAHGNLSVRAYTGLPIEEPLWFERPEEYVERLRELLKQAVHDRLPTDRCAIFMSGGVDSTSVAAVASACAKDGGKGTQLRAYTVDGRPLFDDEEGHYASLAAQYIGMGIQIFSRAQFLPFEGWDEARFRTPEPYNDPFLAQSRNEYQQIASCARVVLMGYGGDDILTGQSWPYLVYLFRQRRFGTIAKSYGGYLLKHKRFPPLRGGFRTRLRRWLGRTDALSEFPRWLEPRFVERQRLRERWIELDSSPGNLHPVHPQGYGAPLDHFWSTVFEAEDASWTGVPIESRAPLLDVRLLRYLLRVPPVPWCIEKKLLREAMKGLLPEEIRLRPKTPLLGDSLAIHWQSGRWNPKPTAKPTSEIHSFVDWAKLSETLENARGSSQLWVGLRALTLERWLKGVEKQGSIRYSQ